MHRKKGVKESQTEKEDVRQQQKGEGHDRYDRKDQIRRQSGRKKTVGGSVSCWPLIVKKSVAPPRMGGHNAAMVKLVVRSENEG